MNALPLPDVTLVLVDTDAHVLSRMAIEETLTRIEPGEILIFSDDDQKMGDLPVRKIAPLKGVGDWAAMIWRHVPMFLNTSHALIQQWDSWVIDEQMWSDAWLQYDYIGAPWPWIQDAMNVGNGGFSLRSKRLLQRLHQMDMSPTADEDAVLCRTLRPELEKEGFTWAPRDVAVLFSYEHGRPILHNTFGFHDVRNMRSVLTPNQLELRFAAATPYVEAKDEFRQAVERAVLDRRLRTTLDEIFPPADTGKLVHYD